MKAAGFLALAIAALAGWNAPALATTATEHNEQLVEIAIAAGRLDAMMDGVGRLLHMQDTHEVEPRTAYEPRKYIELSLKHAIAQFDSLMPVACARHLVDGTLCGRRYRPVWLNRFSNRDSNVLLRARVEDASVPIESLWTALCAHRAAARGHRDTCEIE